MADQSPTPSDSTPGPQGPPPRTVHSHTWTYGRHRARSVWPGIWLVGLGLIFLLDNLHVLEARLVFRYFWPLTLIFWGAHTLLSGRQRHRWFGGAALLFGGLLLGNRLLGLSFNVAGLFWPVLLIGLGLSLLLRPRHRHHPFVPPPPIPTPGPPVPPPVPGSPTEPSDAAKGDVDPASSVHEVAFMAGIERKNVSQAFRGGQITSVMGSVDIDLRDCRIASGHAEILVHAVMGQVILRLPRNWTVESRLTAILGNVEDHSERPVEPSSTRLVLDGTVFMGNVELRN